MHVSHKNPNKKRHHILFPHMDKIFFNNTTHFPKTNDLSTSVVSRKPKTHAHKTSDDRYRPFGSLIGRGSNLSLTTRKVESELFSPPTISMPSTVTNKARQSGPGRSPALINCILQPTAITGHSRRPQVDPYRKPPLSDMVSWLVTTPI